jgi:UDP-N-acetyl-2-amino-2-deoxyglucuronate dehydrogenase
MKYALIGCGRISTNHIKAALANNLSIAAVCDIIPERMERVLGLYNLANNNNISRYTDYKKMISENPDLKLISIATDSGKHAQIALYCIEHRINVIIEKPMAMGMADAFRIIEESERLGIKVCACHQNRFNIAVQQTHLAMINGRFGKLSHGSINVRWNRDKSYYNQADWRGKWLTDGGCLMNQCIHGIDLLRWMMGDEVDEVYGVTKQQFHHYLECEDVGMAVIRFKNGAVGTVEGTVNVFPKNLEETLYLFGEKGTVKLGGKSTNAIDIWDFSDPKLADIDKMGFEEHTNNVYGNGHTSLFADMIDSIVKNRKPLVDAYAGMRALELVLAIYKSSFLDNPVKLPLTDCSCSDFVGFFGD